jgi:hypothetical protein
LRLFFLGVGQALSPGAVACQSCDHGDFFDSSEKSVGEFRFRQFAK